MLIGNLPGLVKREDTASVQVASPLDALLIPVSPFAFIVLF